ncbi:TonB-dependent receptor [Flavobacterium sp. F372]|uniref:TonB-dependent receptor n=1 Tax=Flavobacterium bernardetii TaxID=2813823 RepID=A0ABR7J0I1_9FLAO|nr:TonB-dependent receptor [Flavobacterium bernardetii]MBC5835569.1 TonB-dependent receptor [Flavobacterium bernardetii]NHF70933.1 TonB-dependent receptor [Flavobacterium bernardetii]
MKKYIFLIILMGFTTMGLAQNSVSGTIKNRNNETISNVEISVSDAVIQTKSNEKGQFEIKNLPIGKWILIFKKDKFEIKSEQVSIGNQEQKILDIILENEEHHIDEILVSSVFNKTQNENVVKIDHINLKQIQNAGAINLSDALATNPGVSVVSTGVSIGKPVIRGLSGNRVLTYAQGIRLENQQFGEEHGLGLNANGQESVEIIKGPASLLYGSDAMGGVLYFNPEKYAANNKTELAVNQVVNSNTQGSNSSVTVKASEEKFKFLVQNNYTTHADYKTPNGETVVNTRFIEKDFKIGTSFATSRYVADFRYNYNDLNLGLPEEEIEDSRFRTPLFPSQKIENHLLSFNQKVFFKNSKLEATAGYVFNDRKELESIDEIALFMKLKTFNYNVRYYLPDFGKFETIIGFQGMNQENRNFGEERLIPNAKIADIGFFGTSQYKFNKNLLQFGVRYDFRNVTIQEFGEFGTEGSFQKLDKNFESINASFGFKTEITEKITTRINVATGFRAPNLSELSSNGVHEGSNRYEIGNPNLKNEQNFQVDLNVDYNAEHFDFFANGFYNNINNYIFISPNGNTIDDNFVYDYLQNNAVLFGGETGIHLHLHEIDWLHMTSSYEIVIGQLNNNSSLPLLPANQWKNNFRANFDVSKNIKNSFIFLQANYTFNQNNISQFETKTNDYLLLSSGIGTDIQMNKSKFNLYLTATNLLNKEYVAHLSRLKADGIYNMGRNIVLGVNFDL